MDGVHQGHQLQPDCKQQYSRLISPRGLTGPSTTLSSEEACAGTGCTESSAVSWLPRHAPEIAYRPIRPSDLDVLRELHDALFPIKYDADFFSSVVYGHGIISWAAVDTSRAGLLHDEIVGFVTTRVVSTAEIDTTGMLGYELGTSEKDLVYILTIGVIKSYRNKGIATSLIHRVLDYASTIPTCRAVYLHVVPYNVKAISFYERNSFRCLRRIQNFYYINEHAYDAFVYIYYVNGGRAPCSALDFLIWMSSLLKRSMASVIGWFWRKASKKTGRLAKQKDIGLWSSLQQQRVSMDSSPLLSV
ncbi:hypothetical protein GOP47_0019158 [Adiantum capillus-veneris]|uniref:N-alpha-acetyltransferase 60 n=1 Tax=Adiantum capillus-veneris TaxID=13818 RepID=A0A9D4Z9E1_ADICA|nr:hypothetical protein GOP47_0019158 [Adiantum capillus-veneris]